MIKGKKLIPVLFGMIVVCSVIVTILIQKKADSFEVVDLDVTIQKQNVTEVIHLYKKDDVCYLFLPAYANLDETYLKYSGEYSVYFDNEKKEYKSGSALGKLDYNVMYNCKINDKAGRNISQDKVIFYKSSNVAEMYITLKDGTISDINANQNVKKAGNVVITNPTSDIDYMGDFKSMKGRGNSSWNAEKKPYIIKFNEKANLLKLGESQEWVLVANAYDESNIRDMVVYEAARSLGMKYTPRCEFVDLYVDGTYCGLYLLVQKINVDENSVNITNLEEKTQQINEKQLKDYNTFEKTEENQYKKGFCISNDVEDISGGYLVELTMEDRLYKIDSAFSTKKHLFFKVDEPKYASEQQIDYLSEYFQQIEDGLQQEDILEKIDLKSWVEYYLIQECFANTEAVSFFFYKDLDSIDDKLYAGPVWDFDMALGNCFGIQGSCCPDAFYVTL